MTQTKTTTESGGDVTLFLHLGLHKTATTFLQHVLRDNPDWLAARGALFPQTGRAVKVNPTSPDGWSGHAALTSAIRARPGNFYGAAQLDSLKREISDSGARRVVLSSEVLFAPHNAGPTLRCFAGMEGMRVVPVIYLRRQDHFAESIYVERTGWARATEDRALRGFIRDEGTAWLDYERRLRPVLRLFGDVPPVVRSYDDAVAGPGMLADFFGALGFDDLPPANKRTVNPSLNPAIINMMRALNRRDDLTPARKAEISSELKTGDRWQAREDERGTSLLLDADWEKLRDRYADMNATLADTVMSGPTALFRFSETRPTVRATPHRFTVAEARKRSLNLWPEEPQVLPVPRYTKRAPQPGRALGIVSLQRQTPDQTRAFLRYHLAMGIDRVALFLDNPDDPVGAEFADDPRVDVQYCTPGFWQDALGRQPENMPEKLHRVFKAGYRRLTADGIDWVISIDGDELLFGDLDAALDQPGFQVVNLIAAEALRYDGIAQDDSFGARWFKRVPLETRRALSEAERLHSHTAELTEVGFFGHIQGKSFLHRDAEADIFTHHYPRNSRNDLPRVAAPQALLLHFDCSEFPVWLERCLKRASGEIQATGMGPKRRRQIELVAAAFEKDGEAGARALYDSWYGAAADRLAELQAAGLAFHADLPDDAFDA